MANTIHDKLRQASELSKSRVRQEMQKHYHKVTFTVDNSNTEIAVAAASLTLALGEAANTSALTPAGNPPLPKPTSDAAEAAPSPESTPMPLPRDEDATTSEPVENISILDILLKPKGTAISATAAVQKALDAWYDNPRVKCHLPYERYATSVC